MNRIAAGLGSLTRYDAASSFPCFFPTLFACLCVLNDGWAPPTGFLEKADGPCPPHEMPSSTLRVDFAFALTP